MTADLTKFTLVVVLLGGVLAMAVFRPPIFASPPVEPSEERGQDGATSTSFPPGSEGGEEPNLSDDDLLAWQKELGEREAALLRRETSVQALEKHLAEQATELGGKEDKVSQQWAAIQAEQTRLAQAWDDLQAEQARLARGWDDLQAEQARLAGEWEDLAAERARLDEERASLREARAHLQAEEAGLAEWQQRLVGRDRLSVVALIVSGLMAVPSVVVLIALVQQGWRMPGDRAQQAQAPQAHKRKRGIQSGTLGKVTAAPTYGDNGRCRESVGHPA
jgi:predicted nuclease with TOPRIM domain